MAVKTEVIDVKSLGVKRIAALAAGAAVLGASLAVAADVTYSGVPIIDETGEPKVKIVVGAKAAASDGVAAANIAAMIGNLAYTSKPVTASIEGSPTCTVEGVGEGVVGTCPISNEKATLEVTIPGALTGAAGLQTYINDYVDKKTKNRLKTTSEDVYATSTDLSPFVKPDGTPIGTGHAAKKITGEELPPIATFTTIDAYAARTYTEEQTIWVQGKTRYDTSLKKVIAASPYAAYKIEFTHDDFGIPVATCTNQADGNLNNCFDQYKTDKHRVKIKYLNSDWIISDMKPPNANVTGPATSETCDGDSYIKLAKESSYGIVWFGENLTAGAYTIKFADIHNTERGIYAIVEIYDANNVKVNEARITPAQGRGLYEWTASDGSKVRIRVYSVAPGYRREWSWAEMAVYSEEIQLKNGERVNDKNKDWIVQLCWRNKENEKPSKQVDALRKIILRNEASNPSPLTRGDSLGIIADPTQFQFSFEGLTCIDADYDTLTFTIRNLGDSRINVYESTDCTGTPANSSQHVLYVQSRLPRAFSLGGGDVSEYYVNLDDGLIIYQVPGSNCYIFDVSNQEVIYNVGTGSDKQTIKFTGATATTPRQITIKEYAGATPESNNIDYFYLGIGSDYKFNMTDKATYYGTIAGELNYPQTVDKKYISERGSVFVSVDSTAASFKMAKKICKAQYYVKTTTGVEPDELTTITLAEGETFSALAGRVLIKMKDISQTVGAYTAGGVTPTYKVSMEGVKAVPSETSIKEVVPLNIAANKMVVLDTDPAATAAAQVILIGGPAANEITRATLVGAEAIDFTPGTRTTKVVGNKIIIAGYSAEDTAAEAEAFIRKLIELRG